MTLTSTHDVKFVKSLWKCNLKKWWRQLVHCQKHLWERRSWRDVMIKANLLRSKVFWRTIEEMKFEFEFKFDRCRQKDGKINLNFWSWSCSDDASSFYRYLRKQGEGWRNIFGGKTTKNWRIWSQLRMRTWCKKTYFTMDCFWQHF